VRTGSESSCRFSCAHPVGALKIHWRFFLRGARFYLSTQARELTQQGRIMTKPIPDGFNTITPHIVVQDAAKAIEFYKKALGAQEITRHMTPDGKAVMHD